MIYFVSCEPLLEFNAWSTRKEFEYFAKSRVTPSNLHEDTPTNAKHLKYFQGASLATKGALMVGLGIIADNMFLKLLSAIFFLQAVFFPSQTIPSRNNTYTFITRGGIANILLASGAIVSYLSAWASQPGSTWKQGLDTPLGEIGDLAYPVYIGPLIMIRNFFAATGQFAFTAVVVYYVQRYFKMLWHDKMMEHNYTHEHMNRISSAVYNKIFANKKWILQPESDHEAQHEKRNFVPSIKGALLLIPGLIVFLLYAFVFIFSKSLFGGEY